MREVRDHLRDALGVAKPRPVAGVQELEPRVWQQLGQLARDGAPPTGSRSPQISRTGMRNCWSSSDVMRLARRKRDGAIST